MVYGNGKCSDCGQDGFIESSHLVIDGWGEHFVYRCYKCELKRHGPHNPLCTPMCKYYQEKLRWDRDTRAMLKAADDMAERIKEYVKDRTEWRSNKNHTESINPDDMIPVQINSDGRQCFHRWVEVGVISSHIPHIREIKCVYCNQREVENHGTMQVSIERGNVPK